MAQDRPDHRRRSILKGAIALPALAGLGSRAFAQGAGRPHRFVIVSALTGPGTTFGTGMTAAARTAIEKVNAAGGVLGRPIEPVVVDSGTDPAKAAVLFQDEVTRERPVAAFAAGSTAEIVAVAALATREKVPLFHVSDLPALTDAARYRYAFGTQTPFEGYAAVLASQLKAAGVSKVGLMAGLDGTGEINVAGLPAPLRAAGIEIVATERFRPTDVDMTSQLRKLEAAAPDVFYVEASGAPSGHILQGLVRLGINRPVICGKAMASSNLESLVDAARLPNAYVFNHAISHRGPGGRGESALVQAALPSFAQKSGGRLVTALYIYSWGYDVPLIWSKAASQANDVEADKIVAQLEGWGRTPPTGTEFMTRDDYPFSPDAHLPPPASTGYSFGKVGTLDANGTRQGVEFRLRS